MPLFGPLEANDLFWTCAGGFVTETQIVYATTPKGQIIMFQIIHSAVGLWSPNIQVTFGLFDTTKPGGQQRIWKSVPVTHFQTAPSPKLDKRSSKSDQFSVTVDPAQPDTYTIQCKYDAEVQLSFVVKQLPGVPGWKLGTGNRGGMSYFGSLKPNSNPKSKDPDTGAGSEGYVVHRFWPRTDISGIVRIGKETIDMAGSRGMLVHAIQGMRPNLVASRWDFADFQTPSSSDDGVSLVLMGFTTTSSHGHEKVNVGRVVVNDKLVAVTVGGSGLPNGSRVDKENVTFDKDTGYNAPRKIAYHWSGPAIESKENVSASIELDLASPDKDYQPKGLIEKVDVMAEIPAIIKKVVNAVSGAKPYIYQFSNQVEATINLPALNGQEAKTVKCTGQLFSEATFVSETP